MRCYDLRYAPYMLSLRWLQAIHHLLRANSARAERRPVGPAHRTAVGGLGVSSLRRPTPKAMNCSDPRKHPTHRCIVEDINWAPDPKWATCPSCGEVCSLTCIEEEPLSIAQSNARQHQIEAYRRQELDQAAARLERLITTATAALNYDLDRWMTDGAEWVAEGAT